MKAKRITALLTAMLLTFSLAACNNTEKADNNTAEQSTDIVSLSNDTETDHSNSEYAEKLFGEDILEIDIETSADDWTYLI